MIKQMQISPLQYFIILFNTAFGSGLLTLPRAVAAAAQEDMWMIVVTGGLLMLVALWAGTALASYFPNQTFIEYNQALLGPVLGTIVNLIELMLIFCTCALALRIFVTIIKLFLLNMTPPEIVMMMLLLLATYAAQYGFIPLVRFQEFVFAPNYGLLIMIVALGVLAIRESYYEPLLANGVAAVVKASFPGSWIAFSGPELIIGLVYPYITKKKAALSWGLGVVLCLMAVYLLIVLIVQGILGAGETAKMVAPTVNAYREVEIPDTFIERLDGYLMIIWIPVYFVSLTNFIYFSAFGAARLLRLEDSRPTTILLVPVMYYLAAVVPDYTTFLKIGKVITIFLLAWGLGAVPCLLGWAWFRRRRNLC